MSPFGTDAFNIDLGIIALCLIALCLFAASVNFAINYFRETDQEDKLFSALMAVAWFLMTLACVAFINSAFIYRQRVLLSNEWVKRIEREFERSR